MEDVSVCLTWLRTSSPSQGGEWVPRRHAACLGHRDGPVFTRPDGPRGGGALRPVRRAPCGQRRLRLHGESVGPGDGDLSPHAAGTHQQSLLLTGELTTPPPYLGFLLIR